MGVLGVGVGGLGVGVGLVSVSVLLVCLTSNAWVMTREQLPYLHHHHKAIFRIGLWRVCYQLTANTSTMGAVTESAGCSPIRYNSWDDITYAELGLPPPPLPSPPPHDIFLPPGAVPSSLTYSAYTPAFISKMRWATPLCVGSLVLVALATVLAIVGHCASDHNTLIATGLYIIGGLTLGGGLVVFASVLSDVYLEVPRGALRSTLVTGRWQYRYGWAYLLAGVAFVITELAAVINVTAYLSRFPTVDDMVRAMVPGAERRLREHQGLAGEYLVQHRHKYQRHKAESCIQPSGVGGGIGGGETLSRTGSEDEVISKQPDICSTTAHSANIVSTSSPHVPSTTGEATKTGYLVDDCADSPGDLAGTTVPILLMHHRNSTADRFSTLQHKSRCAAGVGVGGTLPHKRVGVDPHTFAEHLHRTDLEGHMTLNQRFGSALSSGLDSGTGTLVSQQEGTLPYAPKKKSVTIGSVFSTLDAMPIAAASALPPPPTAGAFGNASAV